MWTGTKEWQTLEERQGRASPMEPPGRKLADAFISPLSLILDFKTPDC